MGAVCSIASLTKPGAGSGAILWRRAFAMNSGGRLPRGQALGAARPAGPSVHQRRRATGQASSPASPSGISSMPG
jgi:hypothetical protein